jgi:hypothetical protein
VHEDRELLAAAEAVMLWTQAVYKSSVAAQRSVPPDHPSTPAPAASALPAQQQQQQRAGLPAWLNALQLATHLPQAQAVVDRTCGALRRAAALSDEAHAAVQAGRLEEARAMAQAARCAHARLAALAPLLALVRSALHRQALRWLELHRAGAKLAYIAAAIFGSVLQEGFCGPQDEGEAVEGAWAKCPAKLQAATAACNAVPVGCSEGKEKIGNIERKQYGVSDTRLASRSRHCYW